MKKLIILLVGSFLLIASPAYGDCASNPRDCFPGFEEDGTVIPEDKRVERLFDLPSIKTGFVFDFYNIDIQPHISVELLNFNVAGEDFALDFGIASSRVFGSFSWEFLPIIKAGPFVWGGYNVRERSFAGGLGFTVLDF